MQVLNSNSITDNFVKNDKSFVDLIKDIESERLTDQAFIEELSKPYIIRIVGYLRVSTPGQAKKDKVSLSEQKEQIIELAKRNGWEIVGFYEDKGISGKNTNKREQFNQMIADAKMGKFDLIVGWTSDRLARNFTDMVNFRAELEKYNVQVTTVCEPTEVRDPRELIDPDKANLRKMMNIFFDMKAEQDNKTRVKRMNLGKIGKAKRGKIPCKTPYGYKKQVYYENNDPKQRKEEDVVVDEEATVIREIYRLYDEESFGMRRIAEHLNLKGIPSPNGSLWGYSTIKYILKNPTYTALVRYGWRLSDNKKSRTRLNHGHKGVIVEGKHEAIISRAQFQRVQDKINRRSKLGGRAVSSRGLLSGILKCGRCGGNAYLTSYPNWLAYKKDKLRRKSHKKSAAYLCSSYSQYGRAGCSKRYIVAQNKIEKLVIKEISKLASSKETQERFVKQMKKSKKKEVESELKSLNQVLIKQGEKLKRLKEAYLNEVVNIDEYEHDRRELENQELKIRDKIKDVESRLQSEIAIENQTKEAILALADFDTIWEKANFKQKKDLLQTILEKVIFMKGKQVKMVFRVN